MITIIKRLPHIDPHDVILESLEYKGFKYKILDEHGNDYATVTAGNIILHPVDLGMLH